MRKVIGKIDPSERQVHIWGAGFSGLVLGYYLKNQGFRVTIYEKNSRVGGKIQSKKHDGAIIEKSAHALYLNADGLEFLRELKLEPIPANKKLKRLLLINGKPKRPWQLGLFTKILTNAYKKPPLITDGLTVAEFFRPLMGQDYLDHFMSPVLGGIYSTPSEQLHFKSIFYQVDGKAQFDSYMDFIKMMIRHFKAQPKIEISGSVSFEGGLGTLTHRLAEVLRGDIKLSYKEEFKFRPNTIICTDALSAAELTKNALPDISSELARIGYQELSSVTVFMKREIKSLNKAFGVLIPLDINFNSIGIINNKAIFPSNNENTLSYTLIAKKKLTDDEIVEDLKKLNDDISRDDIDFLDHNHWDQAVPIYNLQRYLGVKKLHQLSNRHPGLAIFGNYVAGISMREMITAAKSFAQDPQGDIKF